jgi:hypothetical protein
MSNRTIRRLGLIAAIGGLSQALFFVLQPGHTLAGADLAVTPQWFLAHSLHFVGALLTIVGLLGIHARQRAAAGGFGTFAFGAVMVGTAMNVSLGLVSAFVWPVICRHSPDMCAATGPIFDIKETFAQSFLLGIVTLVLGWVLFGWSLIRAAVLPANAGRLMIVGAFVFGVMPPPMTHLPFGISVFGGVLLSIGISWAGFAVWTGVGELD